MNKVANATSVAAMLVLMALVVYFWVWLYHAHTFKFGIVDEILPTNSEYSVVILKQYNEVVIASKTSQLKEVELGHWLLLRGGPWNTEHDIFLAESFIVLPALNFEQVLSPHYLLQSIAENTLVTVGFGIVLLLLAGQLLKMLYFSILSGALAFTLWHGVYVANALGWLMVGKPEQVLLYMSVVLFSALTAFNSVSHQQWPSRIIAALLAYLIGEDVLTYFGVMVPIMYVVFILFSAWLPLVLTATLAAYLLANALSASILGAYLVLLLCLLVSLSRFRFAVDRHVVRHLPPSLSMHYIKLKRQFKTHIHNSTPLSGKVSLIDVLKKRGVL